MEDNLQTIVIVVISVFLLFIFPVYMAYEKKDDISYALAMRYTQDLVDEVRSKGYITKYMYEDYRAKLKVTGNSYDINMTHEYNRYDPITNYYTVDENGKYTLVKSTTQEEKENIIKQGIIDGTINEKATNKQKNVYVLTKYPNEFKGIYEQDINDEVRIQEINNKIRIEDTYKISKQVYTTDYITNILYNERKLLLNANTDNVKCKDYDDYNSDITDGCQYAYIMNEDDNFNITIKNTNTTLATVIYNMVTANTLDENTRIYVNYGGSILSSKWYGDIDYTKMDHEKIRIDKLEVIETLIANSNDGYLYEESKGNENPTQNFTKDYDGEYAIEFDVKPTDVTVLRQKGDNINGSYPIQNYTSFNFAIGNTKSLNNNSALSISVGLNGISLITNTSLRRGAATTNSFTDFPKYQKPYITTCPDIEQYDCSDVDEDGNIIEEKTCEREIEVPCTKYQDAQRSITDYSKLELSCTTKGKINIKLTGKSGIGNVTGIIQVSDENGLLLGLNKTIDNPKSNTYNGSLGDVLVRGTGINYSVYVQERNISVSASQEVSSEMTILSHPVDIEDYTNIRVELKEKEDYEGIYNAILYINGEIVDESIDMNYIPKVSVVGMTRIGNEQIRYFDGYIKNVKLYN